MGLLLGIDIGGTNIKAGLVGDDAGLRESVSSAWSGGDPGEAIEIVSWLVGTLRKRKGSEIPAFAGVGSAGLVDRQAGRVIASPNLPTWHNVELAALVREALGLPTVIDNDANAAAYAEYKAGAARGAKSAVVLTLGTGVGGGFVFGGVLYRGARGFAGEVGHATIDMDGEPCVCGNPGCFERLVNASAIVERARHALAEGRASTLSEIDRAGELTARDVGEAADQGDAVARQVVEESGRIHGVGLANMA